MALLGLCFCARAFPSCGKWGPLFIAVRGPLTIVASLVAEHRLQMRRLSNCGSRAQLLRGMWDLSRPGLEPVSPALASRFSTTAPPGKPLNYFFIHFFCSFNPISDPHKFFHTFSSIKYSAFPPSFLVITSSFIIRIWKSSLQLVNFWMLSIKSSMILVQFHKILLTVHYAFCIFSQHFLLKTSYLR